jgi:predicted patatin/cPLA2 family phospholipase
MPILYEVEKPIWEGEGIIDIAIRETILNDAIRHREPVEIRYKKNRVFIDAKNWIQTGKLMEKVFRFKDSPMRLWQNKVRFDTRTQEDKWKEFSKSL